MIRNLKWALLTILLLVKIQSVPQETTDNTGVSASHLDWTMVPYVRKSFHKHWLDGMKWVEQDESYLESKHYKHTFDSHDAKDISINNSIYNKNTYSKAYAYAIEKTQKELKQSVEGMYHNLNSLQSRSGNQLPFSSINYGTCTLTEGRMVTEALLNGSIAGVGKFHRTSVFPCGIFQCMKGVNQEPNEPNYDLFRLALQSTAQRLYPNYANCDWSGNAGYDRNDPKTYMSSMGCRTVNGYDINGLGQLKDGRGNICPVTIILPTLGMMAKEQVDNDWENIWEESGLDAEEATIEVFMELLDKKIREAKDMLIERFEYICSQPASSAKFMYENNTMAGYVPEEGIRSALKHGTIVIGQLGLSNVLYLLLGCDHTEKRGMDLAKRIEQLFKDRCAEYKKKYKLNFGVYYTPKMTHWEAR